MSNQSTTRCEKHVSDVALACFRSGITHPSTYGILVLIPGCQNAVFGYYLASERQIGAQWVYEVHAFSPREDTTTYGKLVQSIVKQTESKFTNV